MKEFPLKKGTVFNNHELDLILKIAITQKKRNLNIVSKDTIQDATKKSSPLKLGIKTFVLDSYLISGNVMYDLKKEVFYYINDLMSVDKFIDKTKKKITRVMEINFFNPSEKDELLVFMQNKKIVDLNYLIGLDAIIKFHYSNDIIYCGSTLFVVKSKAELELSKKNLKE